MQTQRSCQPGCTRIFCVVSAALDFRLMKSEARSAPVVGAPPRRARRLALGSHRHVCNVQLFKFVGFELEILLQSVCKKQLLPQRAKCRPKFLRVDLREQIADV